MCGDVSSSTRRSCLSSSDSFFLYFFFNDTATTEIYTLALHDALPIWPSRRHHLRRQWRRSMVLVEVASVACTVNTGEAREASLGGLRQALGTPRIGDRSEEHTSELQSPDHLVCRLLLEKKNILKLSSFCNLISSKFMYWGFQRLLYTKNWPGYWVIVQRLG